MQSALTTNELNLLNGSVPGGPLGIRSKEILLGTRLFDLEAVVRVVLDGDVPITIANNTAGVLSAGTLVAVPTSWDAANGAPDAVKADADNIALTATHVVIADIAVGETGLARGAWLQENIDTSAYSAADVALYLSAVAGGVVESAPTGATQFQQIVGLVGVKSATLGSIFWCPGYGKVGKQGTAFLQDLAVTADKIALAQGRILRGKSDGSGKAEALDLHVADTIPVGNGTDVVGMVLPTTGIVAKTAAGAASGRTITAGSLSLSVTNGDGVAGNPTIDTAQDIRSTATPTFAGLEITGDLVVKGDSIIADIEHVQIEANYIVQNTGYSTNVAVTGGRVVNYLPTATQTTTVGSGVFTPGVLATSDPTVTTAGAATFAASDLVLFSGAAEEKNNGIFEVLTHAANLLTIKSNSGLTPEVEAWTDGQFIADTDVGVTITKVNVTVDRVGVDGLVEHGKGSATPIVFSDTVLKSDLTPTPSTVIPAAVSGGASGLLTGGDKASLDSLVTGGAGFWSDTADGAIAVARFVEIDAGGNTVAGSIGSDSVVGAGLNAAPVVGTDPIVVGIGKRSLVAADAILAGQELKCAEDGMAISAVTSNNGLASATIGGGTGIEYTNQPANDQLTIESSDAADTAVPITIIGTTFGGVVVSEEIKSTDGANGTTPVDSVKNNWGLILAFKKPVTAGTITVKEKSGGLTIRVIPALSTTDAVIAVAAGNQQAYNNKPEFAADAGTTKVIGFKRIATTGTTETYEAATLNGTAKQKPATASRRVTELYVGDLEAARTLTVTTTATADAQEIRTGRAYSAAAARGDTISAIVRP
ncbi:MAG: hypothetical protein WC911_01850 [Thermoleophilia bacterium]